MHKLVCEVEKETKNLLSGFGVHEAFAEMSRSFTSARKVNWAIKSWPGFSALDLWHHLLSLKLTHVLTPTKLSSSPLGGVTPSDTEALPPSPLFLIPSSPLPSRFRKSSSRSAPWEQ